METLQKLRQDARLNEVKGVLKDKLKANPHDKMLQALVMSLSKETQVKWSLNQEKVSTVCFFEPVQLNAANTVSIQANWAEKETPEKIAEKLMTAFYTQLSFR